MCLLAAHLLRCRSSLCLHQGSGLLLSRSGPLVRLHGKIYPTVCKEILKEHVAPNLRTTIHQLAVFKQDNAPHHIAKSVKTFISEEDFTDIEWTDMNPRENVWKLLNESVKEKNPRNVEKLWTNLKGMWEKISVDECKTLLRLFSKRCEAVIEGKGLHIKY